MFFKAKKPKVDPKIRFQNRQFNQKLQQARTFKRTARPIPEGSFSRFLKSIGLGTIFRQILAILIVGALVYIVYIPNFLTWKTIKIEGMTDADRVATEDAINASINSAHFYNPQHNLLFVSKKRLNEAISKIPAVNQINSIHRDFKNKTIVISITSKYERFLVRSSDSVYDVYNDGATKGVAGISSDYWPSVQNVGMVKIQVDGKITNPENKVFISPDSAKYINQLQGELRGIVGSSLAYIKIPLPEFKQPVAPDQTTTQETTAQPASEPQTNSNSNANLNTNSPAENQITSPDLAQPVLEPVKASEVQIPLNTDEIEIIMQKGADPNRTFRVIIDTKESAHDVVQRLNLLLSQTAPDRYNLLNYIDMRIQTRAFECLAGAPCNK
ncbi:MAG TPA: hypothetical protein VHQ20_02085 [Patescibacteria group bacterium]|jgi:hypothetical protein|nr:hypothetical protein [Patescibacteria group bacterium]